MLLPRQQPDLLPVLRGPLVLPCQPAPSQGRDVVGQVPATSPKPAQLFFPFYFNLVAEIHRALLKLSLSLALLLLLALFQNVLFVWSIGSFFFWALTHHVQELLQHRRAIGYMERGKEVNLIFSVLFISFWKGRKLLLKVILVSYVVAIFADNLKALLWNALRGSDSLEKARSWTSRDETVCCYLHSQEQGWAWEDHNSETEQFAWELEIPTLAVLCLRLKHPFLLGMTFPSEGTILAGAWHSAAVTHCHLLSPGLLLLSCLRKPCPQVHKLYKGPTQQRTAFLDTR